MGQDPNERRRARLRIAALVALGVALYAVGHATGAAEHLSRDRIEELMRDLGALGLVAYLTLFAIGELVHVPGLVFVAAAAVAYGPLAGFAAGLVGGVLSVAVSFAVVRAIGGRALDRLRWAPARRWLLRLEERPVRTIALLRLVMPMLPALNTALALSNVRFRDYIAGSAIGMIPAIALVALLFG